MMRSSSFLSFHPGARPARSVQTTQGVADFLRANDRMAAILPAVTRIAALQRDCTVILPAVFDACAVIQFENGQLVVSTPSAAFAAKLKQQLPKLQESLSKRGWQVNAIRLKVQAGNISKKTIPQKQLALPERALSAFATLNAELDDSPRNQALKAAVSAMLERHSGRGG